MRKLAAMEAKQKQTEIRKLMYRDFAKFVGQFIGVAALGSIVLMLFGVPFSMDLVAIMLSLFIIYKGYILPKYKSAGNK